MLQGFLIGHEEGGVKDRVDLPLGGNAEVDSHLGYDLFYFKWISSFHLELFGSVHVKVSHFKPYFFSNFPRSKLQGYLFLHFLLSHFMGGLSLILG